MFRNRSLPPACCRHYHYPRPFAGKKRPTGAKPGGSLLKNQYCLSAASLLILGIPPGFSGPRIEMETISYSYESRSLAEQVSVEAPGLDLLLDFRVSYRLIRGATTTLYNLYFSITAYALYIHIQRRDDTFRYYSRRTNRLVIILTTNKNIVSWRHS